MENRKILIVDDDPAMQKVLPLTLGKAEFEPIVAENGSTALHILESSGGFDCILLDIRMPGMQGTEVLSQVRKRYPLIPVIMLTALDDLDTAIGAMRKGAFDYLVKPVRKASLLEDVRKAVGYRDILLENKRLARENEEYQRSLERKVEERTSELAEAYKKLKTINIETVKILAETIEAKDPYTRGHCVRVRDISKRIAEELGIASDDIESLQYGALLHDIGKIGISEALLFKATELTPEERESFCLHPVIGMNIVKEVDFFIPIVPIIRYHHERFDGTGYPDGLTGETIPLLARIVTLADAFDAMVSNRPYRKALSMNTALGELKEGAGTQFDPHIVDLFFKKEIFAYLPQQQ